MVYVRYIAHEEGFAEQVPRDAGSYLRAREREAEALDGPEIQMRGALPIPTDPKMISFVYVYQKTGILVILEKNLRIRRRDTSQRALDELHDGLADWRLAYEVEQVYELHPLGGAVRDISEIIPDVAPLYVGRGEDAVVQILDIDIRERGYDALAHDARDVLVVDGARVAKGYEQISDLQPLRAVIRSRCHGIIPPCMWRCIFKSSDCSTDTYTCLL